MHPENINMILKNNLLTGYYSAKDALEKILSSEPNKELKANFFLSKSTYYMSIAKSFYLAYFDKCSHLEIDNIFKGYEKFLSEIVQSTSTEHSHSHSHLYFLEFKEDIESVFGLIDEDNL